MFRFTRRPKSTPIKTTPLKTTLPLPSERAKRICASAGHSYRYNLDVLAYACTYCGTTEEDERLENLVDQLNATMESIIPELGDIIRTSEQTVNETNQLIDDLYGNRVPYLINEEIEADDFRTG